LLLKNATVYIGARSIPKAEAAIKSLIDSTLNEKVFLLQMDLADLHSVKKAAEEFQKFVTFSFFPTCLFIVCRKETKLHVLINNACVFLTGSVFL